MENKKINSKEHTFDSLQEIIKAEQELADNEFSNFIDRVIESEIRDFNNKLALEKRIDSLEKFTTEQARLYNKLLERVGDDSIINKLDYLEDIYDDRTTELELEVLNLNEEIKKLKSYLKNTTWNGSM